VEHNAGRNNKSRAGRFLGETFVLRNAKICSSFFFWKIIEIVFNHP